MKERRKLDIRVMTRESAPMVSALHRRAAYLTPQALCYEYFDNPDASRLYYAVGKSGNAAVASQAFVGQTLIHNGEAVSSMMSERTLLDASMWGRADYRRFFLDALVDSASHLSARFVWCGTSAIKAFHRFGFETTDCFVHDALAFRPNAVVRAVTATSSLKSQVYHAALYFLSLALHALSFAWIARTPWRLSEELPSDDELAEFLHKVSRAHPDSYFMRYTSAKLAWFAATNPFKRRSVVTLRAKERLDGLAIVEDRQDGFATVIDFLLPDSGGQARSGFIALARHFGRQGKSALRYWGNGGNPYIADLRRGLRRLGGVPLRKVDAHLGLRGSRLDGGDHPPASALAMTWIWQPPV